MKDMLWRKAVGEVKERREKRAAARSASDPYGMHSAH